jgi:hypothetical protein
MTVRGKVTIDGTIEIGAAGELTTIEGDTVTIYGPTAWHSVTYQQGSG